MDNLLEERNTAVAKAAIDVFNIISDSLGVLTADASAQLAFNWQADTLLQALRSRHRAINMISVKELIIKQLGRVKEDRVKVDETFSKLLPALSSKEPSGLRLLQHETLKDVRKLLTEEEELLDLRLQATAAGLGVGSAAAGPDTSQEYIRHVLSKPQSSGATDVGLLVCSNAPVAPLDQPLGAKLPVYGGPGQAALNSSSELEKYVVAQPFQGLAASAHYLSAVTTAALQGLYEYQRGGSESMTTVKMSLLVDAPLTFAAASLGLDWRLDRNTADQSGATARKLRPDFLFWVSNVLLFKGEEKAHDAELQGAIVELKEKMATSWNPALLPGVSMPCMFAYAAAGTAVQFFAITSHGGAVELAPLSGCLDISKPLDRIKVVHHTLKVLQTLAAYAPHAPRISIALGGAINVVGPRGIVLRSVVMFQDFVRKRVDLSQQPGGVMDHTALVEMYSAIGRVGCPNLVRLHGGVIRLQGDGMTLMHLAPVGLPLHGPPRDEAGLKQAVRDVLTGLAALHAAGFVHRDIRWPNVILLPAASQSSSSGSLGTYVLIDLEHAARADCALDCRQPQFQLGSWPDPNILDPATGRYTRESDLCLLAAALMEHLPFELSVSGQHLQQNFATRQLTSAEAALQHAWLAAT